MAQEAPGGGRFGLSPSQQRLAVIGVGGVVVLLLLFLLVLPKLFGGGGGGTSAQPPLVRPPVTTTTLAPPPPPSSSGSFEQFQGKNPFTPLANPTSPTGGGTTATTVAGGGGATGTGGATATTVAPGASGGAATAPRQTQRVALVNVYTKNGKTVADVRVNDTVYTAIAPGQTFATNFQLVSLQGQCGTFLFGDERFQLCKGEEVLK
jgi:hypothetical protein